MSATLTGSAGGAGFGLGSAFTGSGFGAFAAGFGRSAFEAAGFGAAAAGASALIGGAGGAAALSGVASAGGSAFVADAAGDFPPGVFPAGAPNASSSTVSGSSSTIGVSCQFGNTTNSNAMTSRCSATE
ncbi:hypothetical protein [Defluviicoccus vanus]|uniref:Uncharacterized protein n=1 Tax=Defluviicoccus vanus TaxID=111831 RepID=A0A7H1N571_9PROT|nr:hypothetical protein [Defluviicoccus vanus]QNT70857.1 hypothetical protein HQ394_17980 [Defluviicoccus vanus]